MLDKEPYWGDFGGAIQMPHCSSLHFNHADTVYQRFDAPALRRSVCEALCGGPGCVITDKTIFTHSAANLYFAAALDYGDCFLGGSSDWFLANAPALGSRAADTAGAICRDTTIPMLERYVTSTVHYCTDTSGPHAGPPGANPMFSSLQTHYLYQGPPGRGGGAGLIAGPLRAVMSEHASGSLCGINPDGQTCKSGLLSDCSVDAQGLCALSKFAYAKPKKDRPFTCPVVPVAHCDTSHGCGVIENDGMVGYHECTLPNDARGMPNTVYTSTSDSRWYRHNGNHEDGTCVNGNDPSGDNSGKPCSWYQEMAKLAVEGGKGEPSPRISTYSCRGDGAKGCVRDAAGAHANETACVSHCAACGTGGSDGGGPSTTTPCGEHGVCSAAENSWGGAELHGGHPFACACKEGYEGLLCDHRSVMSSREEMVVGVVLIVSLLLVATVAGGFLVHQRRRRSAAADALGGGEQSDHDHEAPLLEGTRSEREAQQWFIGGRSVISSVGGSE